MQSMAPMPRSELLKARQKLMHKLPIGANTGGGSSVMSHKKSLRLQGLVWSFDDQQQYQQLETSTDDHDRAIWNWMRDALYTKGSGTMKACNIRHAVRDEFRSYGSWTTLQREQKGSKYQHLMENDTEKELSKLVDSLRTDWYLRLHHMQRQAAKHYNTPVFIASAAALPSSEQKSSSYSAIGSHDNKQRLSPNNQMTQPSSLSSLLSSASSLSSAISSIVTTVYGSVTSEATTTVNTDNGGADPTIPPTIVTAVVSSTTPSMSSHDHAHTAAPSGAAWMHPNTENNGWYDWSDYLKVAPLSSCDEEQMEAGVQPGHEWRVKQQLGVFAKRLIPRGTMIPYGGVVLNAYQSSHSPKGQLLPRQHITMIPYVYDIHCGRDGDPIFGPSPKSINGAPVGCAGHAIAALINEPVIGTSANCYCFNYLPRDANDTIYRENIIIAIRDIQSNEQLSYIYQVPAGDRKYMIGNPCDISEEELIKLIDFTALAVINHEWTDHQYWPYPDGIWSDWHNVDKLPQIPECLRSRSTTVTSNSSNTSSGEEKEGKVEKPSPLSLNDDQTPIGNSDEQSVLDSLHQPRVSDSRSRLQTV